MRSQDQRCIHCGYSYCGCWRWFFASHTNICANLEFGNVPNARRKKNDSNCSLRNMWSSRWSCPLVNYDSNTWFRRICILNEKYTTGMDLWYTWNVKLVSKLSSYLERMNMSALGCANARRKTRRLPTDRLLIFAMKGVVKTFPLWTGSSLVNKRDIGEEYSEHLYLSQPPSAA